MGARLIYMENCLYLESTGRMGVSAQVSTTGFHGEGHMGPRLVYVEYCSVPVVHG